MALIETNSFAVPARAGSASGLVTEIKGFWKRFFATAFNPYRPELHYMRGPGPAWRAKHGMDTPFRLEAPRPLSPSRSPIGFLNTSAACAQA